MILTHISDIDRYFLLNKDFLKLPRILEKIQTLKPGLNNINGITVNLLHPSNKEAKLEAHRKFIDIHITLEGIDRIGFKNINECKNLEKEYDEQEDYMLYSDEYKIIEVPENYAAIFFPSDAHAPLAAAKKLVIKISVS